MGRSCISWTLTHVHACSCYALDQAASQVALYDFQGPTPGVRRIPLIDQGDRPTPVDLQDALPLDDFLGPLAQCREAVSLTLEALQSKQEASQAGAGQRGFGPALQVGAAFVMVH